MFTETSHDCEHRGILPLNNTISVILLKINNTEANKNKNKRKYLKKAKYLKKVK